MSKSFDDIYRGLNYDLINHYEQGVSDERARIIKLLEARILPEETPKVHSYDSLHNLMLNNMIALIKGEQK